MRAAKKRELAFVRPLGCCERFFYLYSLAFPVHFCLVAQIEGALDCTRLGAALEQVRKRHSALRVCIVEDAETGPTFYRTGNPIELKVVAADTAADWRGVVESELGLPFGKRVRSKSKYSRCEHGSPFSRSASSPASASMKPGLP